MKNATVKCYSGDWGPVHTDPGKFKNASFFLRLGQPSTLKRRFRSPKTELFKNAHRAFGIGAWNSVFLYFIVNNFKGPLVC